MTLVLLVPGLRMGGGTAGGGGSTPPFKTQQGAGN